MRKRTFNKLKAYLRSGDPVKVRSAIGQIIVEIDTLQNKPGADAGDCFSMLDALRALLYHHLNQLGEPNANR